MGIGKCQVIGIEGSHGTGKSTLALGIVAECKRRHVHAGVLAERARESPFIEDAVIRCSVPVSIYAELHLLAEQISAEQRMARHHELLVCDKTVANVLGYARLLLEGDQNPFTEELLRTMPVFLSTYAKMYDRVFYSADLYELSRTRDPFRPSNPEFQQEADRAVHAACADLGLVVERIPTGLTHGEKVRWVVERIITADKE